MNNPDRKRIIPLVIGLAFGLLCMGLLRLAGQQPGPLQPYAGFATPGYVLITVIFTIRLVRAGLSLNRFGFGIRPDLRQFLLAFAAIAILRIFALYINPFLEELIGSGRNLERFSDIEGSVASLMVLLILNWTLAAFGEEFAYRIVLMRAFSFVFSDTRVAHVSAVLIQAVLFGLIHAYQGPAGIAGSIISGLIFGTVTVAARWSIWPAALAHGVNNTFGIMELYYGHG